MIKKLDNKKENKKGIIGDTFVWVFATFLIVLILMLYMGIVYYMSEKKVIMGRYDVKTTGEYIGDDFSLLQSFYSFLKTSVVYQDKNYYMKDLLLEGSLDRKDVELYNIVNDTMKKYCNEYYIFVPDVGFSEKGTNLHPFREGDIISVSDGKTRSEISILYFPETSKKRKFIKFTVSRTCLGGKLL